MEEQAAGSGSKVLIIVLAVIVGLCVLGAIMLALMGALLMPAMTKAKEKANTTKCANNLRQLGLGGAMYSGDKRFYPHVNAITELDGDASTNHGPKAIRSLINQGYLDAPEAFVCPSSYDLYIPTSNYDTRQWFWYGSTRMDPDANTFTDGMDDPTLLETDELSYGWTRRGMNYNVRSDVPLSADRAIRNDDVDPFAQPGEMGNHTDGVNVVTVDASVQFRGVDMEPGLLSDLADPEGGALGIVGR